MKKTVIILCSIWTLLMGILLGLYFFPSEKSTEGLTTAQGYAVSDERVYISDNCYDQAVIYKLSWTGSIDRTWYAGKRDVLSNATVHKLAYDGGVYALFSEEKEYGDKRVTAYRLVYFDDDLIMNSLTDYLVIGKDMDVTGLTTDEKSVYLTAVHPGHDEVSVFEISKSSFKEPVHEKKIDIGKLTGKKSEKQEKVSEDIFRELTATIHEISDPGRFIADSIYFPGNLAVRYDNEAPTEAFMIPEVCVKAYDGMKLSAEDFHRLKGVRFSMIILIWGIGIPFIVLLVMILRGKNRIVYAGLVIELVFFMICLLGVRGMVKTKEDISESEYADFSYEVLNSLFTDTDLEEAEKLLSGGTTSDKEAALAAFYSSDLYLEMADQLRDGITITQSGRGLTDLLLVDRETGEILVSDKYNNRVSIETVYGKKVWEIAKTVASKEHSGTLTGGISGANRVILSKNLDGSGLSGYTLVGICNYRINLRQELSQNRIYIRRTTILFLLISAVLVFFLMMEERELKVLAENLKRLAEGRGKIKAHRVHGKDMNSIKNSVFEIEKNIASVNRSKYKIFEAYYRFAPKSIETILGRDSITEVGIGDSANLKGTLAVVSMRDQRRSDKENLLGKNRVFEILEKQREAKGGIYVANNETLTKARLLFPDDRNTSIEFGAEVLNSLREWKKRDYTDVLILLHYTDFFYGVCGTENQSMSFLVSRETEKLATYADWLRSLRLSLVVTDSVLKRETDIGETRYIGFVTADAGKRIDLYEVLSAQAGRVSAAKIRTKAAFEEAIKLYYAQDFFLARNAFTDILRDFPEDELVKWYLFECETRLNGGEDKFTGELHL